MGHLIITLICVLMLSRLAMPSDNSSIIDAYTFTNTTSDTHVWNGLVTSSGYGGTLEVNATTDAEQPATFSYNISSNSVVMVTSSDHDVTDDVNVSSTTLHDAHPPLVPHCRLRPTDRRLHTKVLELLEDNAKLIEFHLTVAGYEINPLDLNTWPDQGHGHGENVSWPYKTAWWSRAVSGHGQTLLKLAFNYQVMSLMTLSFGVEQLDVELQDVPAGCLGNITDGDERLKVVLDIMLRDMLEAGTPRVIEGDSNVCYQLIESVDSVLRFNVRCCHHRLLDADPYHVHDDTDQGQDQGHGQLGELHCFTDVPNVWLDTLDVLLAALFIAVFVFGALLLPNWLYASSLETFKYVIKLDKPIYKTICVSRNESLIGVKPGHRLDLRHVDSDEFRHCIKVVRHLPSDTIIPIKITRLDIDVNYGRLLGESNVPVSLIECVSKALFLCKLRELEAFKGCCEASYLHEYYTGPCTTVRPRPWLGVCEMVGRFLLVLLLPLPFYVRLMLYYAFEHQEVMDRKIAASQLSDLPVYYSYRLMQYLTPVHPIYVTAYVIYFSVGIYLACISGRVHARTQFQRALIDSFAELRRMSWLNAASVLVRNLLFPFRRFGMLGALACLFLYPVLIPLSFIICCIYSLPIVFLSCRVVRHMLTDVRINGGFDTAATARSRSVFNDVVKKFDADKMVKRFQRGTRSHWLEPKCACYLVGWKPVRWFCCDVLLAAVALLSVYSVMLMLAEVAGFAAEIGCFTMMGLIVNATKVLKYGSLIFLVIIYSHDSYSNVGKKYQKLNKSLFSEIKGRISGLAELTSLPSYLQKNMGFKLKADGNHDTDDSGFSRADDFSAFPPRHWDINDLVLFVDSEDMPRIPKRIFDDACEIKIAGTPGPVYLSLLRASGRFVVIIFFLAFVFIVVMSFGDVYKVSSTNQMLATLAGGFIPIIFSKLLKPVSADVETNLVSFKSKLEEIMKNCRLSWPMTDLVFNIEDNPDTLNCRPSTGDIISLSDTAPTAGCKPARDLTNPLVEADDVKFCLDQMTLRPASGFVDLVVFIDEVVPEWDFKLSEESLDETV